MKISKQSAFGGEFLTAANMKIGQILELIISEEATEKEAEFRDGSKVIRLNIPCTDAQGNTKIYSAGKVARNQLIDELGDDTVTWIGAEITLMVAPTNVGNGFVISNIRKGS